METLVPPVAEIRAISKKIARAVALQAQNDGVAPLSSEDELDACIEDRFWTPAYADIPADLGN